MALETSLTRQLHLNAFLMGVGHHEAAWRLARTDARDVTDVRHFQRLAQIAEAGKLDSVFLADGLANWHNVQRNIASVFEPLTLLSALAAVTEHIGLIATVSTTYNEPFHVARKFASLDHLSGGRAGWNIVTSGTEREAQNFNRTELPSHAYRYQRAAEFLDVALRLWDSWDADALRFDAEAGIFADTEKIKEINHVGKGQTAAAPLAAVLAADTGFPERLPELFPHKPETHSWFSGQEERDRHARFNATLQIGYFLVGIRAAGLAAGPMAGFDPGGVDREFFPGASCVAF